MAQIFLTMTEPPAVQPTCVPWQVLLRSLVSWQITPPGGDVAYYLLHYHSLKFSENKLHHCLLRLPFTPSITVSIEDVSSTATTTGIRIMFSLLHGMDGGGEEDIGTAHHVP